MDGRLLEVAIKGNKEMLLKLLEEDPPAIDLDRVIDDCRGKDNPLHVGALYGHVEFVREILNRKPELTRELNSEGQSPLHLASARGHVEVVKVILRADPDACLIRDQDGMIPLHLAAIKGRVQVLETLVEAKKMTAFILTKSGEPILHLCANNNQFKALEKLVELVTHIHDFVSLKDSDDNTILHLLAAKENSTVIRFLLKKTPERFLLINVANMDGFTPLDVAVINTSGLGFVGWKTHFILACKRAKRTRVVLPPKVAERWLGGHHGSWFFEAMLVLAILMVTVRPFFRSWVWFDIANDVNKDGHTPLDVSLINATGLGFGSGTVQFWLVVYGAQRLKLSRIISTINPERMFDGNDGNWFVEALLVVSVLMVTVAFQAGINPPGGVWQDTGYHNATLHNASQSSALKLVHHYAGQSIMSYVDPIRYKYFSLFNNITLSSSMLVIVMLLRRWHLGPWVFKLAPIVFTFISVWAMSAAYSISLSFISSVEDSHSDRRKLTSTTSLLLLGIFFIAYFINILRASCLLTIWSFFKIVRRLKRRDDIVNA